MDGTNYNGRDFQPEPASTTVADRAAIRTAFLMTILCAAVTVGVAIALNRMGWVLPVIDEFPTMPLPD